VSFPVPSLDDRRFQDLVDEAKRMIPQFLPEWTNHNVSDPGVALIELFAWMTDLTLYRLNQLPDRLYAAFLDLVGISPFPAAAAQVPLTFWFSTVPEEPVVVPTGSEVASIGDDPIVFTTLHDLVVHQPMLRYALTVPATGGEPDEARSVDVLQDLELPNESVALRQVHVEPRQPRRRFLSRLSRSPERQCVALGRRCAGRGNRCRPREPAGEVGGLVGGGLDSL